VEATIERHGSPLARSISRSAATGSIRMPFCGLDAFKRSEVEAAVTNVHEARLALSNLERDAAA
jgi:hypothetical protein